MRIFELRCWYISESSPGVWKAHGECYYNPRFYEGRHIHTSPIAQVTRHPDGWMLVTMSGSHYALLESEIMENKDQEKISVGRLEEMKSDSSEEKIADRIKEIENAFAARHRDMKNRTAVLKFNTAAEYYIESAVFKDKGIAEETDPGVHVGMFQDSVLLESHEGNVRYDFRFFPYGGNRLQFYSWDNNYEVTIRNTGSEPMEVDTPFGDFLIPGGEEIMPDGENRFRITEHTAPAIDKHNLWDVREVNGMIAYGSPKMEDGGEK